MKTLRSYLKECMATPMNTLGMGNVSMPTDSQSGSGDMILFRKRNKFKKRKKPKKTT